MRRAALVTLVSSLIGCAEPHLPTPPRPLPPAPRASSISLVARVAERQATASRAIARLTPPELAGAVLGMSTEELRRARPAVVLEPTEHYDFREHWIETVDELEVHYYTLRDGSALYQISIDFPDAQAAEAMWARYGGAGAQIDDLGGKEIVVEGGPWQLRVWLHGARVQWMAVIEGSEWWSQYHPGRSSDGDGDDGNVVP